jgi:hypothetical protein
MSAIVIGLLCVAAVACAVWRMSGLWGETIVLEVAAFLMLPTVVAINLATDHFGRGRTMLFAALVCGVAVVAIWIDERRVARHWAVRSKGGDGSDL